MGGCLKQLAVAKTSPVFEWKPRAGPPFQIPHDLVADLPRHPAPFRPTATYTLACHAQLGRKPAAATSSHDVRHRIVWPVSAPERTNAAVA